MEPNPSDVVMIEQLLNKYGHLVDARAWDRFDELFTADCVVDYTNVRAPKVFHGIPEVLEYFRVANHPPAHHVSNIWVELIDGDHHVHSKFFVAFCGPTHDPRRWYGGDYDDVVVRTGAGWRIARRRCSERWLWAP